MRPLFKPLMLIAVVLAVPIVPFLLLGDRLEPRVLAQLDREIPPTALAALVTALLAVDILLPIPSSIVSTVAGRLLGFWTATAVSWLGMMIGSVVAFALARAAGRPLALRLSSAQEMDRMDVLSARWGPWVLVLARPVPVLAEASVLLFGVTRLSWLRFLAPVALSNLGIAAAYSLLGDRVQFPLALAASVALPATAALLARKWWKPACAPATMPAPQETTDAP